MYGIYCTEARGREAARGLSAINAMHPECTCYNRLISRGQGCHSYRVCKRRSRLARYKDAACARARHVAAVQPLDRANIAVWVWFQLSACAAERSLRRLGSVLLSFSNVHRPWELRISTVRRTILLLLHRSWGEREAPPTVDRSTWLRK